VLENKNDASGLEIFQTTSITQEACLTMAPNTDAIPMACK